MEAFRYASAFASPKGPGDARPTARQIVVDQKLDSRLEHLTVLITGCGSGIGVETARALYETGAQLYLTVRKKVQAAPVIEEIVKNSRIRNPHTIHVIELELDNLANVRAAAAEFLSRSNQLNVLILNAGVMCCPRGKSKDGFELQFAVNHLAHFLLFHLLKPLLLKSSSQHFQSRVVSLSSIAHRFGPVRFDDLDFSKGEYDGWSAYAQSKTSNIHFASEIERRYGPKGLHAWSVNPGCVVTPLLRHLGESDIERLKSDRNLAPYVKNAEQGAATTVWAAIGTEMEGNGGSYLEDCQVGKAFSGVSGQLLDFSVPGYAPHAYDPEAERRLWELSCKSVGIPQDN